MSVPSGQADAPPATKPSTPAAPGQPATKPSTPAAPGQPATKPSTLATPGQRGFTPAAGEVIPQSAGRGNSCIHGSPQDAPDW
uniref:Uncharacterized protein n=1 Tax=Aegilops tauschii subsp. strangulata TaxID=200361 RepID=A0A452Z4I6_AEGTS